MNKYTNGKYFQQKCDHVINIDSEHEAGNFNDRLLSKCKEGDLAAVESCILDGADVAHREDNTCMTGLHFAADMGHTDVVRVLIKRDGGYRLGVDPRTGYGVTPVSYTHLTLPTILRV